VTEKAHWDNERKRFLHLAGVGLELRVESRRCGLCILRNQSWNAGIRRWGVPGRMYVSSHAREKLRLSCVDGGDVR